MRFSQVSKCALIAVAIASFAPPITIGAQSPARHLLPVSSSRADAIKVIDHSVNKAKAQQASSLVVMASQPEGLEFAGVDENEQSLGDYAFAPTNKYLSTKAKSTSRTSTYSWTYYTLGLGGKTSKQTSSSQSISFRMDEGLHQAPIVTASDSGLTATYSLASDGIYFGSGKMGNHDCVNYQPAHVTGYYVDTSSLTLNSEAANSAMDYVWSGYFSGFHLRGFAEMFNYSAPYYLEAVTAEVYCPAKLTADDIEAHVTARTKTSSGFRVDSVDLVSLHVTDIIQSQNENRYRVVFEPDTVTRITSAIAVRIQTPEGSDCQLSIVFPETKVYNSDNTAACALYTDFKIGSSLVTKQTLDFSGIQMADDDGTTTGYLNNFMIGLRKNYEDPTSGIRSVDIQADDGTAADSPVYNLSGRYVGMRSAIGSLPEGIYVTGGKKIIKR